MERPGRCCAERRQASGRLDLELAERSRRGAPARRASATWWSRTSPRERWRASASTLPAVRAAHPRVVYLSLPGFASTDEEHAALQAFEGVIASATGQFSDMGVNRVLMGIEASYSPLPLGSAYAGVFGAMAVALALRARLRHGAATTSRSRSPPACWRLWPTTRCTSRTSRRGTCRGESRRSSEGARRDLSYDEVQDSARPFYRTYWCADGRPFYLVAVSHRRHPRSVLELLGLLDEAVGRGLPDARPLSVDVAVARGRRLHPLGAPDLRDLGGLARPSASRCRSAHPHPVSEWEAEFADPRDPCRGHTARRASGCRPTHARASGLLVEDGIRQLGQVRRMGPVLWTDRRAWRRLSCAAAGDGRIPAAGGSTA